MEPRPWSPARTRAAALVLLLGTLLLYAPSLSFPFLRYDDDVYVAENPVVRGGLTARGVAWAFSSAPPSNFQPLAWLSHMADVSLFGLRPAGHRLVNVLLHGGAALLLFLALRAMTGRPGRSFAVAALFAVHPLQVETVAWVAERKSLLGAFFFFAALLGYAGYVRRPSAPRYLAVLALFVLSLLAKPLAVTFPFVLLLLDAWPLGRFGDSPRSPSSAGGTPEAAPGPAGGQGLPSGPRGARSLVVEKVPFLLLSALSSLLTVAVQRTGGAPVGMDGVPVADRLAHGAISALVLARKAAWPDPLAVFYPYPPATPWGAAALSVLVLAALSGGAFLLRRKVPWLFTGWFWFAGVLFPVSGLVQIGSQATADRYAYLPAVGLFVVAAWGGHALLALAGREKGYLPAVAGAAAVAAAAAAALPAQLPWRSDEALFSHAAAVVPGNWFAEGNLGVALNRAGRPAEAEGHLRRAVAYNPAYRDGRYNLAVVLDRLGRPAEAEEQYRAVLAAWPRHALSLNNLGFLLAGRGERREAIDLYRRALAAQPRFHRARVNLGTALLAEGRVDEAASELDAALAANPSDPAALFQGALAWKRKGRYDEAERRLRELDRLAPGNGAVRKELEALGRR